MKTRHKLIIALMVVVVGIVLIERYGHTWRVEWDVVSGRQRTVTMFLGIPRYGAPEATRLSEWRGESSGEAVWIGVGFSPPPDVMAQSCFFNLLNMDLSDLRLRITLSALNGSLDPEEAKRVVATVILDELRKGTDICDVLGMVRYSSLCDSDRDIMDSPITISELRSLKPRAEQAGADQPTAAVDLKSE